MLAAMFPLEENSSSSVFVKMTGDASLPKLIANDSSTSSNLWNGNVGNHQHVDRNIVSGNASTSAREVNFDLDRVMWKVLTLLGSLHITVWGFALSILILFVGTLAQDEETIVDVKRDYFNSIVAYVPFDVLKPVTIWPESDFARWPGGMIMPGGALIGLVLLVNLIAAKLTRFHMTAKGGANSSQGWLSASSEPPSRPSLFWAPTPKTDFRASHLFLMTLCGVFVTFRFSPRRSDCLRGGAFINSKRRSDRSRPWSLP